MSKIPTKAGVPDPFQVGDRVKAHRQDTMAKDRTLKVLDCRPMGGFSSGWGVQVHIEGRDLYLCAGLFYRVNNVITREPAREPFRPTWDPNDTRF